jgi:hypothetical protein
VNSSDVRKLVTTAERLLAIASFTSLGSMRTGLFTRYRGRRGSKEVSFYKEQPNT